MIFIPHPLAIVFHSFSCVSKIEKGGRQRERVKENRERRWCEGHHHHHHHQLDYYYCKMSVYVWERIWGCLERDGIMRVMMMIKREKEMIKQTRCCVVSASPFAANNCSNNYTSIKIKLYSCLIIFFFILTSYFLQNINLSITYFLMTYLPPSN